jgi:predicted phosphodiesterase
MKILAVSDLHFGLAQYDWVVQQAAHYDLVIIAGDLLDLGGHLDLDSQITIVVKYLRTISTKTRLMVCSGNHDGDEKNEAQEFVARWLQRVRTNGIVVDGMGVDFNGTRLSICRVSCARNGARPRRRGSGCTTPRPTVTGSAGRASSSPATPSS